MLWTNVIIALATLTLAFITWRYVRLTNTLLRLQIEPAVVCGVDHRNDGRNFLVLQNAGTEKIINVSVHTRHFIFRDPHKPPIMSTVKAKGVPGREASTWWTISGLAPGEIQLKNATDFLTRVKHNDDAMKQTRAAQEGIDVDKIDLLSLVFFDVAYQREVDHKSYWFSEAFYVGGDKDEVVLWDAEVFHTVENFAKAIETVKRREGG